MLNNTQTYSDMWQNCLDRIKAQTSEEEFVKWFQPIVPLEFDGTNLRLANRGGCFRAGARIDELATLPQEKEEDP